MKDILSSFPSTSEYTVLQAQPRVNSDTRSAAMTASFEEVMDKLAERSTQSLDPAWHTGRDDSAGA